MSRENYLIICLALAFSAALAFLLTPVIIRFATRFGFVDVPRDKRRMHDHPIPLAGGIAIILAFYAVSFVIAIIVREIDHNSLPVRYLFQLMPGSLIVAGMSMLDDKYDLPALPRLFVQCIAAGITVALGVRISFISGSVSIFHAQIFGLGYLSVPITILWIVGMTNAFNWIDGLDGLASGISSISCFSMVVIAVIQPGSPHLSVAVLAAALGGSCLGFLPFNRHPAKIFMGDTGAMFLGFTLSVISIQGLFKFFTAISASVPLLVLALPIIDSATTVIRRLLEGKSPSAPDRSHIHHKLIDMGLSQRQAVILLYSISTVMAIVAVLFAIFGSAVGWKFFIAGIAVIAVILVILTIVFKKYNHNCACEKEEEAAGNPPSEPFGTDLPTGQAPESKAEKRRPISMGGESGLTVIPIPLGYVKVFAVKGKRTVLVDTGVRQTGERLKESLKKAGVEPSDVSLIVITHVHTDHCGSLRLLRHFTDAPVAVHESEAEFLRKGVSAPVELHGLFYRLVSRFFGTPKFTPVTPDILIGDELDLKPYGVDGRVLHTPGHTQGSVSVVLDSGDAIVGDLFGGRQDGSRAAFSPIYNDLEKVRKSLGVILSLGPQRIYTSHGGVYPPQTVSKLIDLK